MKTLDQLENGKKAKILEVKGGRGLVNKLSCVNIREGKTIKKIISQPLRGPVIVLVGSRQCAIGRGMAKRILVEEK